MRLTLTRRPLSSPGQSFVPWRMAARMPYQGIRAAGATTALVLLAGCGANMSGSADPAVLAEQSEAAAESEMDGMDMGRPPRRRMTVTRTCHDSEGDGTEASLNGYTLEALETRATTQYGGRLTFRIMQENGVPLTTFEPTQSKPLHLFLVSEDLNTYHHLHPTKNMGGTWTAEVPALPAGRIHVVADFVAIDEEKEFHPLVLGEDLTIDGAPAPVALPEPEPTQKVDGYSVSLGDGLVAGQEAKLSFKVTEKGKPAALEPYLNSWAHTSVFAADSLAFAHIHPAQEWKEGQAAPEELTFVWTPAAPGTYRFFIQFQTASGLHLAEFTRTVTG